MFLLIGDIVEFKPEWLQFMINTGRLTYNKKFIITDINKYDNIFKQEVVIGTSTNPKEFWVNPEWLQLSDLDVKRDRKIEFILT